jgi:hypothetical protein
MGKLNFRRWLLAGLMAGVVYDIVGFLVDGLWLKPSWNAGMQSLGLTGFSPGVWGWFNVLGICNGLTMMWIYVGIRPRLGPGVNTAFKAGLVTWVLASLLPNMGFMVFGGLFSHQLAAYTTLGCFIECILGAIAGAALYKEASV